MRLYEFESKDILNREGIRVPQFRLIRSLEEIGQASAFFPGMIKVQTLSGGRAKRAGVKRVDTIGAASEFVRQFLGKPFGEETVEEILLEEWVPFEAEYYLGIVYDGHARRPVVIFSSEGGVNLNEIEAAKPETVKRLLLNPLRPLRDYHATEWLSDLGFRGRVVRSLSELIVRLAGLFFKYDALLLEINPLVRLDSDEFCPLDCHMELDEDALDRIARPELKNLKSRGEGARKLTAFEQKAREIDSIDHRGVAGRVREFSGNLGLLIGGGGASLTIFDAIQDLGGKPANYCEIGGNPMVSKVSALTKLLVTQPRVEKLAVIMNVVNNTRADLIARGTIKGIVESGKDPRDVIVVFRLPGSGEEECKKILKCYQVEFQGREMSIDQVAALAVARVNRVQA